MDKFAQTTFPQSSGHPKVWIDRKARHTWSAEIAWPRGSGRGRLDVRFDGQLVSTYPDVTRKVGRAAFSGHQTRFMVKSLRIEGVLDPTWVIEELVKKGVAIPDRVRASIKHGNRAEE